MLELDASQIQMGCHAADKAQALAMLSEALVEGGLATAAYLQGLQAREAQGSTFLGQGVAIPHGTPQTRDHVLRTGVRLIQFPEGVDWGNGQQVYLAIGIAAQSDEHLHLLQLLTRALGEGDLSQALRQAREPEQLVELLQGAPQALALDGQLVGLGLQIEDFDELLWQGARLLRQAECASSGFALGLARSEPLPLGEGLWWLHSEQSVLRPGLAFVTPAQPLQFRGEVLKGLFCLASQGEAHRQALERLCDVLIGGRAAAFSEASDSRQVIEALGGEVPPDWPSLSVPLLNAHGLHARPAKILCEVAQAFTGEVRVRLAGGPGPGVSAKSLSKLLSLGARRGQVLEFSAEPAIAGDALAAIEAAVQAGQVRGAQPLNALEPHRVCGQQRRHAGDRQPGRPPVRQPRPAREAAADRRREPAVARRGAVQLQAPVGDRRAAPGAAT